jgi:hypothetical protein
LNQVSDNPFIVPLSIAQLRILDPPGHLVLPADDADNADRDPELLMIICVNLRDLRGNYPNSI